MMGFRRPNQFGVGEPFAHGLLHHKAHLFFSVQRTAVVASGELIYVSVEVLVTLKWW